MLLDSRNRMIQIMMTILSFMISCHIQFSEGFSPKLIRHHHLSFPSQHISPINHYGTVHQEDQRYFTKSFTSINPLFALNQKRTSNSISSITTTSTSHNPTSIIPNQYVDHYSHSSVKHSTLLKYSNLSQEEEKDYKKYTTGAWKLLFHLPNPLISFPQLKPHESMLKIEWSSLHSPNPLISFPQLKPHESMMKVEWSSLHSKTATTQVDHELKDSTITTLKEPLETILQDIDVLPNNSPMIFSEPTSQIHSHPISPPHHDHTTTSSNIRSKLPTRKFFSHRRTPKTKPSPDKVSSTLLDQNTRHTESINRDIRHLALSIASNVDTPEQWMHFCKNGGGLKPILDCIREAAQEFDQKQISEVYNGDYNDDYFSLSGVAERREDAFAAACSACKTLRGLCGIDSKWSAIITDQILQYDDGNDSNLFSNLVTLLTQSSSVETFYQQNRRSSPFKTKKHPIGKLKQRMKRLGTRRQRVEARRRCSLYITQLLLSMAMASDKAVHRLRKTPGLIDAIKSVSSYSKGQRLRNRLIRYPFEILKRIIDNVRRKRVDHSERAFLAAKTVRRGLTGSIQAVSNQLLATLGHNVWVPKVPGQKGLRILTFDGGGTRGIASTCMIHSIVEAMGGVEVADSFDIIAGTSTGAIIAFLVGLRRESSKQARQRYDELIEKIFVKSHLSAPMLFFTTASYSDHGFQSVMESILGEASMISSRADPRVPYVFAISSSMSSNSSKLFLFRNYNYEDGENPDKFVVDPEEAKKHLKIKEIDSVTNLKKKVVDKPNVRSNMSTSERKGSRHEGSFRVLQRVAMRATTAAPTFFKPVLLGGEMFSDGGIVAANPTAVAIHEARMLFPDVPIEMVVSCGTGDFVEERVSPSFGWDGIAGQIIKSATDTSKVHHLLEDVLGQGKTAGGSTPVSNTKYFRLNPVIGTQKQFPLDGTDQRTLGELCAITTAYMNEPEQVQKLKEITTILSGKRFSF